MAMEAENEGLSTGKFDQFVSSLPSGKGP